MELITYIVLWAATITCLAGIFLLARRRKEYELAAKNAEESKHLYDNLKNALEVSAHEWRQSIKYCHASYRFTESDISKFGNNHQGMEKEAKQRMACALGRRIVKELGATEIIEDGVLAGFRIDIEAKKKII